MTRCTPKPGIQPSATLLACLLGVFCAGVADASFVVYGNTSVWRAAVGGPTIQRLPGEYYTSVNQIVDPEVWADVGVHLMSSGVLKTDFAPGIGMAISSGIGQTFEVRWDQPITALWYRVQAPTGVLSFYSGSTFLGGIADGQWGVTSTIPFDRIRISFPDASAHGFLWSIEWGVVPGPSPIGLLALVGLARIKQRSRR